MHIWCCQQSGYRFSGQTGWNSHVYSLFHLQCLVSPWKKQSILWTFSVVCEYTIWSGVTINCPDWYYGFFHWEGIVYSVTMFAIQMWFSEKQQGKPQEAKQQLFLFYTCSYNFKPSVSLPTVCLDDAELHSFVHWSSPCLCTLVFHRGGPCPHVLPRAVPRHGGTAMVWDSSEVV